MASWEVRERVYWCDVVVDGAASGLVSRFYRLSNACHECDNDTEWVIALFFIALGAVNLYVVYNFDTEVWVNFKLFGLLGLSILFVIGQAIYVMRPLPEEEQPTEGGGPSP